MELKTGLEPATSCLRCRCSAIELLQHMVFILYQKKTQSKVLYETYILCYNCIVGVSMNELDYGKLLQYFTDNSIIFILLLAIFFVLLIFLISKTIRKSGLFLLLITFLIDRVIRSLPFNLYGAYPSLVVVIMAMYFIGMFLFFLKVFNKIFHKDKNKVYEEKSGKKDKTALGKFFSYTGSLPLLVMMVVNMVNAYLDLLPRKLVSNLTSLSFLFMVFITLVNTYRYIDKKDLSDDFDNIKFKDLKKDTDEEYEKRAPNRNEGRRILKTKKEDNKEIKEDKKEKNEDTRRSVLKDIKYQDEVKYDFDKLNKKDLKDANDKSYDDLLSQVTRGFDQPMNTTVLSIKNLLNGESLSHVTKRCIAKIIEDEEYKVDLEFKDFNEYDYGKFIDILMEYSKDKKSYKFELELMPEEDPYSKIVFYDPSEIFDSVKMFSDSFQGKNISMNFPKYKINFVTSN